MKKMKSQFGLIALTTLLGLFTLSSFIDEDEGGGGGGVAHCLNIHTAVEASEGEVNRCYWDQPGPDTYEGMTVICFAGSGYCNKVTCDKNTDCHAP